MLEASSVAPGGSLPDPFPLANCNERQVSEIRTFVLVINQPVVRWRRNKDEMQKQLLPFHTLKKIIT